MSSSNSRAGPASPTYRKRWAPEKIRRIVRDIENSPKMNLHSLLMALLARLLLQDEDLETSEASFSATIEKSKALVELMRSDAAAFCEDERNMRATEVKRHLRDYQTQKNDSCRLATLCIALNKILSDYRDKQFGDLLAPSQHNETEELIFIPNDLAALESDHIAQHMPRSKRRPDILATYTSTLRESFKGHKDAAFEDWVQITTDDKSAGPSTSTGKLRWPDVHQIWEVTTTGLFDAAASEYNNPEIEKAVLASKSQDRSASSQRPNSRKRRSEEELTGRSKKARVESEPEPKPKPFRLQVADEESNLLPELRCAYYASDRLSSSWNIMHSTAILLEDTKLSLRWYDAQGCFQSDAIDIVDQMPLFIVMLIIFQRFNERMWGLDTETVESEDSTFEPDREARCRFELIGRRTFAASAVRVTKSSSLHVKDDFPLFYKSSWVKCTDSKEPDTINTAHQRANNLLPEKFRKMVTDHIPTVIASRVCNKSATSTIRLLVREIEDSAQFKEEDIRKHARVRVWLVTRKLEPMQGLDPAKFWQTFLELFRCHYLLWKIGIAHRDISNTNLMCTKHNGSLTGVLNDYDYATVMDPGCRHPPSDGYERVGTTPFISIDLPAYRDATLTRWYRHDVESFAWCLIWEMLSSPPRSWTEGDSEEICITRRSFLCNISDHLSEVREEWLPYFLFAIRWFNYIRDNLQRFEDEIVSSYLSTGELRSDSEKTALRDVEDEKKDDEEHAQQVINFAREKNLTQIVDVVRDASWVSVELLRT